MVDIEVIRSQVVSARELLNQKRQEAQQVEQELESQKQSIPESTSQQALRSRFSGIQGRTQRQRFQSIRSDIESKQQSVGEFKRGLSDYEKEVALAEGHVEEYDKEVYGYNQAKQLYGAPFRVPPSFIDDPYTKKYYSKLYEQGYEQRDLDAEFNQNLQAAVDKYNQGVPLNQAFKGMNVNFLVKQGVLKFEDSGSQDKITQSKDFYNDRLMSIPSPDVLKMSTRLDRTDKTQVSSRSRASLSSGSFPLVSAREESLLMSIPSESNGGMAQQVGLSGGFSGRLGSGDTSQLQPRNSNLSFSDIRRLAREKEFKEQTGQESSTRTLTRAPSVSEQFKGEVGRLGVVKGTLSFLGNKGVRLVEAQQTKAMRQGKNLYQPVPIQNFAREAPQAVYFTQAGPALMLIGGAESYGKAESKTQKVMAVGELGFGAIGLGRQGSKVLSRVEKYIPESINVPNFPVRIKNQANRIYNILEPVPSTNYGYIGRPKLNQGQRLLSLPDSTYGLVGVRQPTFTQQVSGSVRRFNKNILDNEFSLYDIRANTPERLRARNIRSQLSNSYPIYTVESANPVRGYRNIKQGIKQSVAKGFRDYFRPARQNYGSGLLGRSPEFYQTRNIVKASRNAGFQLNTYENINPMLGYNYGKNQLKQKAIGYVRNLRIKSTPYGLLGRSPEFYRGQNLRKAARGATFELQTSENVNPYFGYAYAKRSVKQGVQRFNKNILQNDIAWFNRKRSPEFYQTRNIVKASRNANYEFTEPNPVEGYKAIRSLIKYRINYPVNQFVRRGMTSLGQGVRRVSRRIAQPFNFLESKAKGARQSYVRNVREEIARRKRLDTYGRMVANDIPFFYDKTSRVVRTSKPFPKSMLGFGSEGSGKIFSSPRGESNVGFSTPINKGRNQILSEIEKPLADLPKMVGGEGKTKSSFSGKGTYEVSLDMIGSSKVSPKSSQARESIWNLSNVKTNQANIFNVKTKTQSQERNIQKTESVFKSKSFSDILNSQSFRDFQTGRNRSQQRQEQRQRERQRTAFGTTFRPRTMYSQKGGKVVKVGESRYIIFIRRYGQDNIIGETSTLEDAKRILRNSLTSNLGRSGFIETKGSNERVNVNLGFGFRPSKKQKGRVVQESFFSLGSQSERREIQRARKSSNKSWNSILDYSRGIRKGNKQNKRIKWW